MVERIPLVDLRAQYALLKPEIGAAIEGVLDSARFILGDAVASFEQGMAAYLSVKHAIGVGSGYDALCLALRAVGVTADSEVILPANTYIATALAVSAIGARPVLVDCEAQTYQVDPALVEPAITSRTKAIIPVHLYGQPADMDAIGAVARAHALPIVEDAAQAHGARFADRACGSLGRAGCFSFYPSKNLGAYGDGGMVVTDDDEVAERMRQLRNYGQRERNDHVLRGVNSRLDSLQAAVLGVKLRHLDQWNGRRAAHAARYSELLAGRGVLVPTIGRGRSHVFHLYVVRSDSRDALRAHLAASGIETGIHYPTPIHLQPAYRDLGYRRGAFPVAEQMSREVLSLPMFPELSPAQIERVAASLAAFTRAPRPPTRARGA
jgi:dTDP-4-amino-4,6-dideoxygalactose transaminase